MPGFNVFPPSCYRMSELQTAHEKQLEMATERSHGSKQQVAALQQQLQSLQ